MLKYRAVFPNDFEFFRFSGVTEADLKNVTTTIRDVQAVLLSMFSSETILCGHSLDSDLKALKVILKSISVLTGCNKKMDLLPGKSTPV